MSENQYTQLDSSKKLDELLEPLFAEHHRKKCYPGLIFKQGKRDMVQIHVPAEDLPTLLQAKHSTNNDPDSGKNRPEVKGHSEEIKDYILKRVKKDKPWILGTLTANIDPNKIEIIELGRGICLVVIPRGIKLDITDGQHRKSAIHELIESSEGELIGDNDFPITLVLEEDFNQCQTDFRDMAQTRALDKSLLLSFGESEGRVGITKDLVEKCKMFSQKTEKIKNSPDTKKKLIYTTNYIAKMVGCAFSNDPNNELKNHEKDPSFHTLLEGLNLFFSECNNTKYIFETSIEDVSIDQVSQFKDECLLGTSVGLEILGRLLYFTYDKERNYFAPDKISEISQLDWSKESRIWANNVVLSNSNPSNSAKLYRITASANAVKQAVNTAKSHLGWT